MLHFIKTHYNCFEFCKRAKTPRHFDIERIEVDSNSKSEVDIGLMITEILRSFQYNTLKKKKIKKERMHDKYEKKQFIYNKIKITITQ